MRLEDINILTDTPDPKDLWAGDGTRQHSEEYRFGAPVRRHLEHTNLRDPDNRLLHLTTSFVVSRRWVGGNQRPVGETQRVMEGTKVPGKGR